MGNDGGTIVRRADLVRVKEDGKAGVDPAVLAKVLATTCALSFKPLAVPVVSDSLGRLYNKESVVKYLLQRGGGSEKLKTTKEANVAGHLRGLKDVRELKLSMNPATQQQSNGNASSAEDDIPAPFICPLNQRPMNGKHRYIYLAPCGCVMSESGLRAVIAEQKGNKDGDSTLAGCPVCGTTFSTSCLGKSNITAGGDIVILNGTEAEIEEMRICMEKKREVEAARRKELKAAAKDANTNGEIDEEKAQRKEEKRKRKEEIAKLLEAEERRSTKPRAVESIPPTKAGLVAAEAKNNTAPGKEMSAAMRSIYGLDRPKQTGDTWMTRGTFNRFA